MSKLNELHYELTEALSRLTARHPFFAVILYDLLKIVETDAVPTAGVDGKCFYVNPDWFSKLTLEQRVFVAAHEVLHVVLEHPKRGRLYLDRGIGPDMKAYSPTRMNMAMDYIINDWLITARVGTMPPEGLHDKRIGTLEDIADEVYLRIPDTKSQEGSGAGCTGNGWDHHMTQSGSEDAPTKADIQRAIKSAESVAKSTGKIPANMQRIVDEICEPQVDWRSHIYLKVTQLAGRDDTTWSRPNRKRLAISPHVYMPGKCAHRAGTVVIYFDSSGSVSDTEIALYKGAAAEVIDAVNPEQVWIGSCDTKAYTPHEIQSSDELRDYVLEGGGGTHMPAIFSKLEEESICPDVLIILTDGHTDFGRDPGYPVLWVCTTNEVAPFGDTVHIKSGR